MRFSATEGCDQQFQDVIALQQSSRFSAELLSVSNLHKEVPYLAAPTGFLTSKQEESRILS